MEPTLIFFAQFTIPWVEREEEINLNHRCKMQIARTPLLLFAFCIVLFSCLSFGQVVPENWEADEFQTGAGIVNPDRSNKLHVDRVEWLKENRREVQEKNRKYYRKIYDPKKPRIDLNMLNFSAPYVPKQIRNKEPWEKTYKRMEVLSKKDARKYRRKVQKIADENIILPVNRSELATSRYSDSRDTECIQHDECKILCDHDFINKLGFSWHVDHLEGRQLATMKASKCYQGCCFRLETTYMTCSKKCWRWFLVEPKDHVKHFEECKTGCNFKCHHQYNAIPSFANETGPVCQEYSTAGLHNFVPNLLPNEWKPSGGSTSIRRGVQEPKEFRKASVPVEEDPKNSPSIEK